MGLLQFTEAGIFCEKANIYIDPWKPVDHAVITHGHSDHARYGNKHYIATHDAVPVIRYRLGEDINIEGADFGESFSVNGVKFSFHPAGHIFGSAQVRVEYKGEVWVVSGDYKTTADPLSGKFEPLKCDVFITESTFGLPVFKWKPDTEIALEINEWRRHNIEIGKISVIAGYALGKAQRILKMLDHSLGPIYTHGAIENINNILREQGVKLPETTRLTGEVKKDDLLGSIVIATPSALNSPWMRRLQPYSTAIASGWMSLRGARRRRAVDRGFVLSDHADWNELNEAIKATGAEEIYVTHGYTSIFSQWLREQGFNAQPVATEFEGELGEINEAAVTGEDKENKE
ncbi:MAG: ligase-associated DNA damage response exonuclease [Candidatus Cyclobacteriaceae bacterium M2_1C_046]